MLNIHFYEPLSGLWRNPIFSLYLTFRREGLLFKTLSMTCIPDYAYKYNFLDCPVLYDGWLLMFSKQLDNLKLDCNGNHTVSIEVSNGPCRVPMAKRNFAFFKFENLDGNSLHYKTQKKGKYSYYENILSHSIMKYTYRSYHKY